MGQFNQIIAELTDKDFNLFREVIYRESGINLSPMKKALVQSRLMRRMRELQIRNFNEYYDYLNDNYEEERIHLINCITTNKTDFFREAGHFDYMKNEVLPKYVNENKKTIRIWSAGCSTGEEPYTIAISLLEYFKDKTLPDIKILATDIDTKVLETAMEGVYKEETVKVVDREVLRRYALKGVGSNAGFYRMKDSVKKLIHYRRLNLLDDTFPLKNKFDIIFCRNVVIYFDRNSQVKLFKQFYNYLNNDGYLFIGHSETLTSVSNLFHFRGRSVYGKVL
ncbi:MAG TPA: protein-glutamate O-methyltransferase CheR [Spirochaetota bacterium]|nr:protein-glutamate O-methyltransferase CheR [Spirochaetota bacterium]HPJ37437.1 protein-glutamate O-methyltransferase CheR [Spirochaetota bacterium]HPQ52829.1 protein-glutamate O-methyltransferase CheR [Spirochaetota bacterium]